MVLEFFRKQKYIAVQPESTNRDIPEGVWVKCSRCNEIIFSRELERNCKVCQKCGFHFRASAYERIAMTLDEGTFKEMDAELLPVNPYRLAEYEEKLKTARKKKRIERGGGNGGRHPAGLSGSDSRHGR